MKVRKYDTLQIRRVGNDILFSVISNGHRNDFIATKEDNSEKNMEAYQILRFLCSFEVISNKFDYFTPDMVDKTNYALKTFDVFQLEKGKVIVRTKMHAGIDFLTQKLINYTNEHGNCCANCGIYELKSTPFYQFDFKGKNGFKQFVNALENAYYSDISDASANLNKK